MRKILSIFAVVLAVLAIVMAGTASAKSVYVIAAINAAPTPIEAYDIQVANLVYQATHNVPSYAGGAVGLGICTCSETLFVTYEFSNTIQLLDAKTFADLGTTTALGASNLAGIVMIKIKDFSTRWTVGQINCMFMIGMHLPVRSLWYQGLLFYCPA